MLRAHLFLRCSCARFISSEMVAISVEKVKLFAREKLEQFLNFAYDKQNGHVFGKTFKGWGQKNIFTSVLVCSCVFLQVRQLVFC